MTKLILIISCFFLTGAVNIESIYTHSVTSIEGDNKPLTDYQGKMILIMTLPIQQNISNDSLLNSLDSLRTAYPNTLKIIGVPSYEDGYSPTIKNNLITWYRSILNTDIIITEGIYTRKSSGILQHPLFKFLTDKERNGHFNEEVTGPRLKFFIWTDGELVGLLGTHAGLNGSAMNSLLQSE